jgi:hypothetical protein
MCTYDEIQLCPAGGTTAERQDILLRMFVHTMRDSIEMTGI